MFFFPIIILALSKDDFNPAHLVPLIHKNLIITKKEQLSHKTADGKHIIFMFKSSQTTHEFNNLLEKSFLLMFFNGRRSCPF